VRLDMAFMKQLDLHGAAKRTVARPHDHFPPLITDRCLEDGVSKLTAFIASSFAAGTRIHSETLTMPRRDGVPRPVTVLSPASRALYRSLVEHISDSLPPPSRAAGRWEEHRAFGLEGAHDHVVDIDIASCYEYIDHESLWDELNLRSMNLDAVGGIISLLGELYERPRGLPQMLDISDRLGDAYLSRLERSLQRDGLEVHRFADDLRVIAGDWESANIYLERAAEYARRDGLILSTKKSTIYKRTTLARQEHTDSEFFVRYFQQARQALTRINILCH
jgi:RNA-directed DNA polymerase